MIKKIRKRDGRLVSFEKKKIAEAIFKSAQDVGGQDKELAERLAEKVVQELSGKFKNKIPTVENVQDIVEKVLIETRHAKTAKNYILYRQQKANLRETKEFIVDSVNLVEDYIGKEDWRVYENANATYSVPGLLFYSASTVTTFYALHHVYPKEIAKAHIDGHIHIHNLQMALSAYCAGWSLRQLLHEGFNGVPGKVECRPPKHLRSAIGQMINFIGTLQNEWSISKDEFILAANHKNWCIKEISKLPKIVEIFTFDKDMKIKRAKGIVEKHGRFPLLEIIGWHGHKIKITPYHSLFTLRNNKIIEVKGDTLRKGDEIIIPLRLPIANKKYTYDLKKTSSERVYGKKQIYLERGKYKIPQFISLNESLSTLFGLYVSEGTSRKNKKGADISFSIARHEEQLEKEIVKACITLGFPYRVYKPKFRKNETYIFIGSKIVRDLFVSKCGHIDKHVPPEVFLANEKIITSFLKACFSGDGYIKIEKNGSLRIIYKSVSKELLSGVMYLLRMFGIISKLTGISLYIIGKKDIRRFYESIGFYHEERMLEIKKYLINHKKEVKEREIWAIPNSDLGLVTIKKINMLPEEEVYDICVPGTENFIGGSNPICLHNSGAQAFNSVDTYLAPFVKQDKLSYKDVKQCIQEYVYNMNVSSRWSMQSPFTNITLDLTVPEDLAKQKVTVGGKLLSSTYSDYIDEMQEINKAFIEVLTEGDAKSRVFTFPIPTYNLTKNFDWNSDIANKLFEMTAKYGLPYFQNFISSDLDPSDIRSMCCRLRLDLRKLQRNVTGGRFSSGESTGSVGVVTLNLPKIAYEAKNESDFFEKLERYMYLAKESLEIKRKLVERNIQKNLLPYTKRYLGNLKRHFSTIGLIGMHEACLNLLGRSKGIETEEGHSFAIKVLKFMREKLLEYQKETSNIYNLEATPGEGASYRLAHKDKKQYPKIITAGKKEPYYTNSTWLPVGYTTDIFTALKHQEPLQKLYTGGTVSHIFLGESINKDACKLLVKKIASNFSLPYFTITPTFSICEQHGYLRGEKKLCPKCKKPTEVYSRVVGYFRPTRDWNLGKQSEFRERKVFRPVLG